MPKLTNVQKAVIALIIANIIWGAAAPIFKWSLESIPAYTLAFLRFGAGSLILFPFVRKNLKIRRQDLRQVILLGIFGVSINISFFFEGLRYAKSINAPIIASSGPIFIILFGALFLKDHIKKRTVLGALIGLLGVLIIVLLPAIEQGFDTSFVGNIFFIVAMLATVMYAIIFKKLVPNYHSLTLVFWSFLIGTIGFLPMLFNQIVSVGFLPVIDTRVITGILFGVLLCSSMAYALQGWAIKHMPVENAGLFTYVDPVIAILVAYPLLGEIPTVHFFTGSILVFLGIYIAERRIHWHPLHKLRRQS
jgi:drug/metabolite transporter (DMT)-like permease